MNILGIMKPKNEKLLKSAIEYLPIALTVFAGIFITLLHQFRPLSSEKLLGWILLILSLLATSILIDRFTRLNRIEKSTSDLKSILGDEGGGISVDRVLSTRKELHALESRLSGAKEIFILGGSLFRLTSEYLSFFEEKAKEKCLLRFLVVSPDSQAIKYIAKSIVYEVDDTRKYKNHVRTSLQNLKKLGLAYPEQVRIRLYDVVPSYSVLGSIELNEPESEMMIEFYTYKTPTRDRPHLILNKGRDQHWFSYFKEQFEELWGAGKDAFESK